MCETSPRKRGRVQDGQGLEVANADADAIAALDFVREEWLACGTRFDRFFAAADKEEKCALLPVLAANLAPPETAAGYLARAKVLRSGDAREAAWIAATEARLAGDADRSLALHEKLVTEWRRDLLSGGIGQHLASTLGDAEAQLRLAAQLAAANPDNVHACGQHAFALSESNRLDEAETLARRAIASRWAQRALAQCFEVRGRMVEGVSLCTGNAFLTWHLALFLIDLDRTAEALALCDGLAGIDAISLLARLELRGVDVGGRWADVASSADLVVPFVDLHNLYALARAGKQSAVTELLAGFEDRSEQAKPFEREAWADCAVPAAHGLAAHARGDHAEAARLLGQAMPHLGRIGGSMVQRALFGAIHLDALIRSGWNDAAVKILQADERERPTVPATKRALADLYRKLGRAEQAMGAEYQASQLARQYRTAA